MYINWFISDFILQLWEQIEIETEDTVVLWIAQLKLPSSLLEVERNKFWQRIHTQYIVLDILV